LDHVAFEPYQASAAACAVVIYPWSPGSAHEPLVQL